MVEPTSDDFDFEFDFEYKYNIDDDSSYYNEEEQEHLVSNIIDEHNIVGDTEYMNKIYEKPNRNKKINIKHETDMLYLLDDLKQYCDEKILPLCEKLTVQNLIQFVYKK